MSILVGKKAPDFTAPAVLANGQVVDSFNLAENVDGKYAIVFFYPLDFTFVCPSEIIAMSQVKRGLVGHRSNSLQRPSRTTATWITLTVRHGNLLQTSPAKLNF